MNFEKQQGNKYTLIGGKFGRKHWNKGVALYHPETVCKSCADSSNAVWGEADLSDRDSFL